MLERFYNVFYGDVKSSYDGETRLWGECYCVGEESDDEGFYWRSFTPDQWELVKHLTNEEIYTKYPAATFLNE